MAHRDPLAEVVTSLDVRPLDARFAERVAARARGELRSPAPLMGASDGSRSNVGAARFRWAVSAALVPALLSLVAVVETATTASTIAKIYGKATDGPSK
jgi:hypothetical protein